MDDVILNVLNSLDQVAQYTGIVWNFDPECIFNCSHGADGMYSRSDTANALSYHPGFARIAPFEDKFDAAPHGAGCPGILDSATIDLDLDSQVSFNAGNGIYCNPCHRFLRLVLNLAFWEDFEVSHQ